MAAAVLQKMGLPLPGFPTGHALEHLLNASGHVAIPEDLSEVGGEDLSNLMAYWTAIQNYSDFRMVPINTDLEVMERQKRTIIDGKVASQAWGKTLKVTEAKAVAMTLPEVQQLQDRIERARAVYSYLEALARGYERNYNVVSREVTRRTGRTE